nr:extracellular solute-binding protein [Bradyrhizobium yuanmingense]
MTEDEYDYSVAKILAMVESKTVTWDVIDIAQADAMKLCDASILETIDWNKLGLHRSKVVGSDNFDCRVPSQISATVIAYDEDKLANGPKTIADLFDMQRFPGKRGLLKSPYANLDWALIADGVATKDVYKVLNTSEGLDRAFKKLDTIKKEVIWWTAGAQPPQLLADGQVIMTAAYNGRIFDAVKNSGKHFEIMWDAAVVTFNAWAIPKGDPRQDDAYKFIIFAASPQAQADLTRYIPYGPTNKHARALVDPAILTQLPTETDHDRVAVKVDSNFWADKGSELRQRFTNWLAK